MNSYTRDDMVFIVYHVNWPGANDWYYTRNTTQNQARWGSYGVDAVPWFQLDGLYQSYNINSLVGTTNSRIGQYTPVEITMDDALINDDGQFEATVTVNTEADLTSSHRLSVILIDQDCAFGPAPNGIDNFRYNMLQMQPGPAGGPLDIAAGGSETFTYTFDLWTDTHEMDNYAVIAFVQDSASDQIMQVAYRDDYSIPFPYLTVDGVTINDDGQAMPNGRPDPGETVELVATVSNGEGFALAEDVTGTLVLDVPGIDVITGEVDWTPIDGGQAVSNADNPFVIEISENMDPAYLTFAFEFEDVSGAAASYEFLQLVGQPEILVVNDPGDGDDAGDYWFDMMLGTGLTVEVMDADNAVLADLSAYESIIWSTSNASNDVLTAFEQTVITSYLNNGGKLLLTGENIGQSLDDGGAFLADYFAAEHDLDAVPIQFAPMVIGVPEGPFPDAAMIIFGNGGGNTSVEPSSLTVLGEGIPLYEYIQDAGIAGVGYQTDTFTSVYLAFNIESASGQNDTDLGGESVVSLLQWMDVEADVDDGGAADAARPTELELGGYPNPFNATLNVTYNLPEPSEVSLRVINTLGQQVAELQQGTMTAGSHKVAWHAADVASGVYLVSLQAGEQTVMRKVVLMK